jgi:hypothetical protein
MREAEGARPPAIPVPKGMTQAEGIQAFEQIKAKPRIKRRPPGR